MTQGFQQQGVPDTGFRKSAPAQQNGQKPDPQKAAGPVRSPRTFKPRPGH